MNLVFYQDRALTFSQAVSFRDQLCFQCNSQFAVTTVLKTKTFSSNENREMVDATQTPIRCGLLRREI